MYSNLKPAANGLFDGKGGMAECLKRRITTTGVEAMNITDKLRIPLAAKLASWRGATTHRPCNTHTRSLKPHPIITGDKFGCLTVLEPVPASAARRSYIKCQCDCGTQTYARIDNLLDSKVTHCSKYCTGMHRLRVTLDKAEMECLEKMLGVKPPQFAIAEQVRSVTRIEDDAGNVRTTVKDLIWTIRKWS